jgi:heme O synthase-like polyprenyltransferase
MSNRRPFLPLDKPRSWTLFVVSGLVGMAIGLVGFVAASFELRAVQILAMGLFMVCWTVAAVSWVVFVIRFVTGQYRNIQARAWKEQVW